MAAPIVFDTKLGQITLNRVGGRTVPQFPPGMCREEATVLVFAKWSQMGRRPYSFTAGPHAWSEGSLDHFIAALQDQLDAWNVSVFWNDHAGHYVAMPQEAAN